VREEEGGKRDNVMRKLRTMIDGMRRKSYLHLSTSIP